METEYARELKTGALATKVTLVLGGTGKTGRRVAQRLKARGVATRIGSRSG
jgi:phosphoglycerate dehydrogenase-like enzyme